MEGKKGGGRPPKSLDIYRLQIAAWIQEKVPHEEILRRLNEHERVSTSTYYHRIRAWDLQKNQRLRGSPSKNAELESIKRRITELVYHQAPPKGRGGITDKEILEILLAEGHSSASLRTIMRIRRDLGIVRRVKKPEKKQLADAEVRDFLEQELASGNLPSCGKEALKRYFLAHGRLASRDRIFQTYKSLRPEEVEARRRGPKHRTQQRREDQMLPIDPALPRILHQAP